MTPQEEAIQLLGQVLRDLTSSSPDLKSVLRRCRLACKLVGWTDWENWFGQELDGYPLSGIPQHRQMQGTLVWQPVGTAYVRIEAALRNMYSGENWGADQAIIVGVYQPLDWVIAAASSGYSEFTSEKKKVGDTELGRVRRFDATEFDGILKAIERYAFDFAGQAYSILRYGNTVSDIFSSYRTEVDRWLNTIGLKQHLDVVSTNLQSTNPANWRQAVIGCRTLISEVANYLWQDPRQTYAHLEGSEKRRRSEGKLIVDADHPKNRLSAYVHQKGFRQTTGGSFFMKELERWDDSVRSLFDLESSAKGKEFTLEEARSVALATYFIIGELVIKTDVQPIKTYGNPATPITDHDAAS